MLKKIKTFTKTRRLLSDEKSSEAALLPLNSIELI